MTKIKSHTTKSKRGFTELISIVFVLKICVVILIIITLVLVFMMNQFGLDAAAREGATITSDRNVAEKNPGTGNFPQSYLSLFQAQAGKDSYVAQFKNTSVCNEFRMERDGEELKSSDDSAVWSCVTGLTTRRQTMVRPGFIGDAYFYSADQFKTFPFKYVDRDSNYPGYDKTQRYPFVNIRRSCAESFNESSAAIGSSCTVEKAQSVISPGFVDFDGDHKEDIVMFQPVGTADPMKEDSYFAPISDYDVVAYLSGAGFVPPHGIKMFNLSMAPTDSNPPDQFIALDIDQDGKTDPTVFSPGTGEYRFISSLSGEHKVFSGDAGISDPGDIKGLVAYGGSFTGPGKAEIAIVQTAGAAADRFRITLVSDLTAGFTRDNGTWSFSAPSATVLGDGGDEAHMLPIRGAAAYPAFADVNGDGLIEGGYLSVYTGMPVKHVAGAVADDAGSTPTIPGKFSGEPAKSVRLNPKDIAFGSEGHMFILDPVAGAIHRTDDAVGADGELGNITTLTAGSSSEGSPGTSSQDDYWPAQNVVNLPARSCEDTAENEVDLGSVSLCNPRSIAVANCADCNNDLIIADSGHNALYVAVPDSGTMDKNTLTYKLLDSDSWANDYSMSTTFFPLAVLAVPNPTERGTYDILVANDYSLYLLRKNEGASGAGPRPKEFKITRIAGSAESPFASSTYYIAARGFTQATSITIRFLDDPDTKLCPIVSLARKSDGTDVYAGLSCGTAVFDGDNAWKDSSSVSRNVGGIIRVYSDSGDLTDSPKGDVVLGSFRAKPCYTGVGGGTQQCGVPQTSVLASGEYGLFKRKINLSETNPRAIAAMNIVGLSVGSKNEVYFVDQWNENFSVGTGSYYGSGSGVSRPDRIHAQGVYRLYQPSSSMVHLEAISNPSFFGDNSIPVEHRKWLSPYLENNTVHDYIEPFEAPASQVPFPAGAGIAINPTNEYLFAATMWLVNPEASTDPYYVEPQNVGFIFGAKLDTDGDGELDSADSDVDGDGVADATETDDRNPFCPEIWGDSSKKGCRWAEAARVPRQYYFNLDKSKGIDMPSNIAASVPLANAFTIEYLFFNSVSAWDATKGSRPEPWALLFSMGHYCAANISDDSSPYYNCRNNRNGPIPSAVPLHSFVGAPSTSFGGAAGARSSPALLSPIEQLDQARLAIANDPTITPNVDRGNVAFPVVFDSTEPWNRGIKPTRREMADIGAADKDSTRSITSSGALCIDGKLRRYGNGTTEVLERPFKLNLSITDTSSYLRSYLLSGAAELEDGNSSTALDNDNLNYIPDCSASDGSVDYRLGDSAEQKIYSEGIVLQLDHDYTIKKITPSFNADDIDADQPGHWMPHFISGFLAVSLTENAKGFTMLDFDGNGSRDFGVYYTDVEYPSGWRTDLASFTLTAAGLKSKALEYVDEIRFPLSTNVFGFNQYPGAWAASLSTPWFRFKNKDWQLWMFDKSKAKNEGFDESFAISLDNQPYLSRGREVTGAVKAAPNNYANYVRVNRFVVARDGTEPPGLVAAKRYLKRFYFFNDSDFVTSLDSDVFVPGKVFVGFFKDGDICPVWARSLEGDYDTIGYCDEVHIEYKKDGTSAEQPVLVGSYPVTNISEISEKCDPTDHGGTLFPCQAEAD
jgi:hypothetical protein